MAKCVRCGKSFLGRLKIKLKDAEICGKCYDELGFDPKTGINIGSLYKWDDIKDGYDAMRDRENAKKQVQEAANIGLNLKLYRQLHKAQATDPEIRLMSAICSTPPTKAETLTFWTWSSVITVLFSFWLMMLSFSSTNPIRE